MAMYEYQALTEHGRLMRGTIEAVDPVQARQLLEQMRLTIQQIDAASPEKPATPIGREEFALFNQQLASLTKAGIPLNQGLRQLARDAGSRSMKRLMEEIAEEIERGVPIEKAVEKRKESFPPLYGRILKAGIETGRLSEMLTSLNRHIEIGQRTHRIISEALCYPAVVFVLTLTIVTVVMRLIIPSFKEILLDFSGGRVGLPLLTQFFLDLSENIIWVWAALIAVVTGLWILIHSLSLSAQGRAAKESLLSMIPVIGRINRNGALARLSESMAVLISAGCPMPQSLRLAGQSSGSEHVQKDTFQLAYQIEQGFGLLDAAALCKTVPMLFLYSVQLGSQRNELQDHLYSLGQMYARQTYSSQARLEALMAPILIIVLGGFVALMIIAMFLPMISGIRALM